MEAQLLYAERLSLLGQLAPRIAHEFKTPLQLISGRAEMAVMEMDKDNLEAGRDMVQHIIPATEQMTSLVDQMLNLGKPAKSEVTEIDLASELERILATLGGLGVVKYCSIEKEFEPSLPLVYGDPAQIEQIFRNLIVNAAQAMEGSMRKEMKLSLRASTDREVVEAVVYDTGNGIAEEHMDQIFQPFFTTKSESKGTGLGLPIVKTIVDRHQGSIGVTSEIGRGTRIAVRLPAHNLAVGVAPSA